MDEQDTSRSRDSEDRGRHIWPTGPAASPPPPLPDGLLSGLPHAGAEQVLDLIQRAERHELGRDFLVQGAPDAVAATFGVHAFLVDAARDHMAGGPED